jgi:hypothetical protein
MSETRKKRKYTRVRHIIMGSDDRDIDRTEYRKLFMKYKYQNDPAFREKKKAISKKNYKRITKDCSICKYRFKPAQQNDITCRDCLNKQQAQN